MSDPFENPENPAVPDLFRPPLAAEDRPVAKKARGQFLVAVLAGIVLVAAFGVSIKLLLDEQGKLKAENERHAASLTDLEKTVKDLRRWDDLDARLQLLRDVTPGARPAPTRQDLTPDEKAMMAKAQADYDAAVRVHANPDGWLGEKNAELRVFVRSITPDPDAPKEEATVLQNAINAYRSKLVVQRAATGADRKTGEVK